MNACPVRMTIVGASEPALTFCRWSALLEGSRDTASVTAPATPTPLTARWWLRPFRKETRLALPGLIADRLRSRSVTGRRRAAGMFRDQRAKRGEDQYQDVVAFISDSVEVSQ